MRDSLFETLVGLGVVVTAVVFLMFSLNSADRGGASDSYSLTARFTGAVNGLATGTDVRLQGVKVGVVTDIELDKKLLAPVVMLSVERDVELDEDTIARIASDGFLNGPHISLVPGSADEMLQPGDEIQYTSGSVELGPLLTEFAQTIDRRLQGIEREIGKVASAMENAG